MFTDRETGSCPPPHVVLERQTGVCPNPHVVLERQTGVCPNPHVVLERQTGVCPNPHVVLERQTGGRPPPHVVLERQTGGLPRPDVVLVLIPLSTEAFSGPSNIQFVGQTSDSLRFRWSPAGWPVSGYVVQYTPLSGLGQPITADLRQVGSWDAALRYSPDI